MPISIEIIIVYYLRKILAIVVYHLATPTELHPQVDEFISTLSVFNPLWQEDLHLSVKRLAKSHPSQQEWVERVEDIIEYERKVSCKQSHNSHFKLLWMLVGGIPTRNHLPSSSAAGYCSTQEYSQHAGF